MLTALAKLGGINRNVMVKEFGLRPEELKFSDDEVQALTNEDLLDARDASNATTEQAIRALGFTEEEGRRSEGGIHCSP